MIDFGKLAKEIFSILRQYNYTLIMYDGESALTREPESARIFYDKGEDIMVNLGEDGENSYIELLRSDTVPLPQIQSLRDSLVGRANVYNLNFNMREFDGRITPAGFSRSLMGESRKEYMDITENMYGTTKSSYLKLENARLIVKHSGRVDEEAFGARSRKIDRIFVENDRGERFLLPTNQLLPARAMVQHVNHGGSISDMIGDHIDRMARAYRDLGSCIRHVRQNADVLPESAAGVSDDARNKRHHMRRMFERLYRSYDKASDSLVQDSLLTEMTDDVLAEAVANLRTHLCAEGACLADEVIESLAQVIRYGDEEPLVEAKPVISESADQLGNPILKQHFAWLENFDADHVLAESARFQDFDITREDMILPDNSSPDLYREVVKRKPKLLNDGSEGSNFMVTLRATGITVEGDDMEEAEYAASHRALASPDRWDYLVLDAEPTDHEVTASIDDIELNGVEPDDLRSVDGLWDFSAEMVVVVHAVDPDDAGVAAVEFVTVH